MGVKASNELLIFAVEAVDALPPDTIDAIARVDTCSRKVTAVGHLLADMSGASLTPEAAGALGKRAASKAALVQSQLGATARNAARRAGRVKKHEGCMKIEREAADERSALLVRADFDLPAPLPQRGSRKRASAEELLDQRLESWSRQKHGISISQGPLTVESFLRHRAEVQFRREARARVWRPTNWRARTDLARAPELQRARNDRCTCNEGIPSWLCRVSACYANEVGTCMETECEAPGQHGGCSCMEGAWGYGDKHQPLCEPDPPRPQHDTKPDTMVIEQLEGYGWDTPKLWFSWLLEYDDPMSERARATVSRLVNEKHAANAAKVHPYMCMPPADSPWWQADYTGRKES